MDYALDWLPSVPFFLPSMPSHDHYLVASLAWAIAGAIAGFLPFNYPKAKAFLGDAGSHLIGFLIAIMAILPHFYSEESDAPWVVLAPIPILGVFLIDLAWVVSFRWMHGLPVYQETPITFPTSWSDEDALQLRRSDCCGCFRAC